MTSVQIMLWHWRTIGIFLAQSTKVWKRTCRQVTTEQHSRTHVRTKCMRLVSTNIETSKIIQDKEHNKKNSVQKYIHLMYS